MERIDKIIASQGLYSRSDVKYLVKHKRVAVDGEAVTSSSRKADPEASVITIDGKPLIFKKQLYLMLHKPQGYVSATEDKTQPTVLELVPQAHCLHLILQFRLPDSVLRSCLNFPVHPQYYPFSLHKIPPWDHPFLQLSLHGNLLPEHLPHHARRLP